MPVLRNLGGQFVRGAELKAWKERQGFSNRELAELANAALGRNYSPGLVSTWCNEKRPVPEAVGTFFEHVISGKEPHEFEPPPPPERVIVEDTAPPSQPNTEHAATMFAAPGAYAKACEEMWDAVAMGLVGIGSLTGKPAVVQDGQIIHTNKVALGQAWGKLAEENATVKRWITSAAIGGAWVQVALVTGQTGMQMYANHVQIKTTPVYQAEPVYGSDERRNGDEPPVQASEFADA